MEDLFIPALVFAALINKTVDWIRILLPDWVEGKVLIPLSMIVGVSYALLFAQSSYAESIPAGKSLTLATIDISGIIIFGLAAGAIGSQFNDFKPTKLTTEQVERAVEQADTLVVQGDLPAPLDDTAAAEHAPARE